MGKLLVSDIDVENSFIAIRWNFMMRLKSKIEDKQRRHPSFLIYYSFPPISCSEQKQSLNIIGIQASSVRGIHRWTGGYGTEESAKYNKMA